jgi:molybdopterin-guanine dinucleotide biosynthesis protein A
MRMGQPKAALALSDGTPFGGYLLSMLARCTDQQVVVGHGVGVTLQDDMVRIQDLAENAGPLSGIAALLGSGYGDRYLIVPCDMALLFEGLLRKLITTGSRSAVFKYPDGSIGPLPCVIHSECAEIAVAHLHSADRSLRSFIGAINPAFCPVDPTDTDALRGCNTPHEYAALYGETRSGQE